MSARDLDQHSLQPGACSLCAAASKVIANFGEIFSIYYLFPPGLHQGFVGLLVCVQQRGHHLVSSHLRNSTSVSFDTYINAKRKCFQSAQFLDPRFHSVNETVILVHESQLNIHQWY